ncbi:Galactosylceramide sulfotransferase [Exaiptasia diaphana]|nr:Galactosylceramide sulfotransferase [Exaiptasia diaphana]
MAVTWANPHILCNHARYNKRILRHLFPKDESIYITILREPFSHYESVFNYFELWKGLGIKDRSRLLRNPMLYDLGLDFRFYQDETAVRKYIKFLEREFELVMMMEYFDESVVLLKRMMCWDIDDIVFIKHNERQKKDKKRLSPLLHANIKRWNQADFILYNHFNKTFWKKIEAEGPDFYKDLSSLRRRNQEVFEMCVGSKPIITEIYRGKFVQGHGLKKDIPHDKKDFCTNLVKSELEFHKENMQAHRQRQSQINDQGVFANELIEENSWDKAKDLTFKPIIKL